METRAQTPDEGAGTRRARRAAARAAASADEPVDVDVVVIGAGQAGLSAAYHLVRSGLVPVGDRGWQDARATFVVLDDNPQAGGAWQHRWDSLTMADAHAVHDLPGMPLIAPDPAEPANRAVPYYYAQYEEAFGLRVQRPVRVSRVADDGAGRLLVRSELVGQADEAVTWRARGLVNASGTWQKPFWPAYPGRSAFRGRQLHTHDFRSAEELADGHVVVVGGGTSAVQLTMQLARVTTTTWVTRRPPTWRDEEFSPEIGREAVARVDERTRAGLAPESVVSVTGLPLTDAYREAIAAGVLRARPMFTRIVAEGVVWDDPTPVPVPAPVAAGDVAAAVGSSALGATAVDAARLGGWVDGPGFVEARTILWCTGFRASLDHLAPLHLRGAGGGIVMEGTQVVADPRIQLVGYGPSASTIGANRAGREAVRNLRRALGL
jgi:cation diffusion facilitator CzcD-associated flavoprotein CzcO